MWQLEAGPWSSSSLKKEFSKETDCEADKVFIRSKLHVEEHTVNWWKELRGMGVG